MATFTRRFSAQTRNFYYKRCHVSISERYMGFDSQGFPSYFDVTIIPARLATREDFLLLQQHPGMKNDFFRDGDKVYYFDIKKIHFECLGNIPLFPIRNMKWAENKTKEIIDQKYS